MAVQVEQLITEHLDLWTQAQTAKSTSGRGSNNKIELTGIKKLRELILELAVRGKLVPQDPNDEPASELLKRIAAEKDALVKAGKLKKQKPLPPITDKEKPFELPNQWEFKRLGDVAYVFSGNSFDSQDFRTDEGIRVVKISNVGVGELIETDDFLPTEFADKFCNFEVNEGDLVMALTRPYISAGLKVALCSLTYNRALLNQRVAAIRADLNPKYLYNFMQSTLVLGLYQKRFGNSGLQPNLKVSDVTELVVPVPPNYEQQRIANKVDELMALCDQLEQQSYQQLDAHNQLVDALLATLTQSQNAEELASNWQRLAAHFDTLFTTEYSIVALKQTILQLAVMGKLVKQDPNDEPASELLKRIATEKDTLVKAKSYQNTAKLLARKEMSLPLGWVGVQMGEICISIVPTRDKPKSFRGDIPWVTLPDFPQNSLYLDHARVANKMNLQEIVVSGARIIPPNSILMSCVGRFGLTAINRVEVTCNQQVHAFVVIAGINPEFLSLVLRSSTKQLIESSSKTTVAYLNKSKCESIQLGLPPINEQFRIVSKVAELFSVCDSLSSMILANKRTQTVLAEALVEQVVA